MTPCYDMFYYSQSGELLVQWSMGVYVYSSESGKGVVEAFLVKICGRISILKGKTGLNSLNFPKYNPNFAMVGC